MQIPILLAQTPQWLAVAKPSGWLTIPPSSGRSTEPGIATPRILVDWVRENFGNALVLHRIDRETSGVVLFARTAEDQKIASEWFSKHRIKKAYDCLASGIPSQPVLKISEPIGGAKAVTQVEVRDRRGEGFLARAVPVTGRRHQIRIHLASRGHPLWGDVKYGGPSEVVLGGGRLSVPRVALHAARLELPTREVFEAAWPEDFRGWVERLKEEGTRV